MDLQHWLNEALANHEKWTAEYGSFTPHSSLQVDPALFGSALAELQDRLRDNYPFFHPRYAGQMLKPPHPAAVVGYLSAMLINPNNHALDGGPATAAMEREVVSDLAAMFGYGEQHLGHLTSSGTIANLEALFVARSLHPSRGVAYSSEAHYTHSRMCGVLGIEGFPVAVDGIGRMDLDALEELLKTGKVGTVVVTPGTTALGAIEQVHLVLDVARRYDARVHVDGAYGGFFTLLAGTDLAPEPWAAIASCDSVVVDPHKHGLQPYGCGAVLFRDPSVGRFYLHDSPYTYFTSDEMHLGEISLECSRAGAAAAGLWLTLRLLPLTREGLGEVLAAGRRAAVRWASIIRESEGLELYQEPELDIVTYFPRTDPLTLSAVDAAAHRVMETGMNAPVDPVFLSVARASKSAFAARHPEVGADADGARVLRSVLMKPESEDYLDTLHARVLSLL
ncbi:aminotransferase class I/II-fold pyridoxal phosphate-dependent enzyme [Lentzea sp. BCCO 10_0798]|uniref:Aminotransferase class I/II-fold pyridoxal phosphate-dependent enzyme n=1 Tax=Lentzea kristufekii TaxID=3095430 RepID=A0ABU4TKX8_9PSEU|nr:aminotransferase class I/II-fold pyridoxal phosphate-dependent enzyme [Lentzea sp. BCCO 10_0798]MDX8048889.1 aminotransferase class I/II-fold pyridoxal phosphate-dependent enzyme [Lentzea sp. BCCO 10_0798]